MVGSIVYATIKTASVSLYGMLPLGEHGWHSQVCRKPFKIHTSTTTKIHSSLVYSLMLFLCLLDEQRVILAVCFPSYEYSFSILLSFLSYSCYKCPSFLPSFSPNFRIRLPISIFISVRTKLKVTHRLQ